MRFWARQSGSPDSLAARESSLVWLARSRPRARALTRPRARALTRPQARALTRPQPLTRRASHPPREPGRLTR
jgi:hypothetical protein